MIEHRVNSRLSKKVGIINKFQLDAPVDFRRADDQIEFCCGHGGSKLDRLTTANLSSRSATLRQVEQYLKNRIARGITRRVERFDDAFEGQVLMGVGVETDFADTIEQIR